MAPNLPSDHSDSGDYPSQLTFLAGGGCLKELRGLNQEKMNTIYRVAYSHYCAGRYGDALTLFHYLSLMDHHAHTYLLGLGATLMALKQFDRAFMVFEQAESIDKKDPRAHICKVQCLIEFNNFEKASDFLKKAEFLVNEGDQWEHERQQIKRLKKVISQHSGRS
ncbi:SycD/LcrH family type III secretion system chaperone [Endozoicomonas sp. Mp262]|uniref:SycD/LcrH family type III secretion system chaperone n=1 Tax=Endozoicomonas sp. Mp262 TaxID=2919499 RepID=UPI0021D8E03F